MRFKFFPSNKNRAFTLIELLVVISIISLLASIIIASVNEARERAKETVRNEQVRQLKTALESYYLDHGYYPGVPNTTYGSNNSNWGDVAGALVPNYATSLPVTDGLFVYEYQALNSCPAQSAQVCVYNLSVTDGEVVVGENPTAECADGIDNDNDNSIDFPNDSDCLDASDNDETTVVVIPPIDDLTDPLDHLTNPGSGWTAFATSTDQKIIYVSESGGDNGCDGSSPNPYVIGVNTLLCPKKTIKAGVALMRDGKPDWLLLKRGDTFDDPLVVTATTSTYWKFLNSGRSITEKALVASYGEGERPVVKDGFQSTITVSNIALVGLKFDDVSINVLGKVSNLLVEDNYFGRGHINFQGTSGSHFNIDFKRNVVVDSYSTVSHSQGLFSHNVDGLIIEENIFDHNGWLNRTGKVDHDGIATTSRVLTPGSATVFNHNVYISSYVTGLVFENNISARASSHGIQARRGGVVDNNLFIANPISLLFGADNCGSDPWPTGVSGSITNNVVLDGNDINGINTEEPNLRGWGIHVANINLGGVSVIGNLVANEKSDNGSNDGTFGIHHTGAGSRPTLPNNCEPTTVVPLIGALKGIYEDNVVYNWGKGLRISGNPGSNLVYIVVKDNVFYNNNVQPASPPSSAVTLPALPTFDQSVFSFSGNKYFYSGGNPDPNRWDLFVLTSPTLGTSTIPSPYDYKNFTEWLAISGEAGASNSAPTFPPPNRTIESYKGSGSLEAFLTRARAQSKSNWDPDYTANAVNEYMRAGFGL